MCRLLVNYFQQAKDWCYKNIYQPIFFLVFFILLVSLIQVGRADNSQDLVFNLIIFVLLILFGFLLIRSFLNEVNQHKQLQTLADDLQKTTLELKRANEELKSLDEAKSDFLSIASHQLRTPLTVIKGYGSMIKDGSYGKVPAKVLAAVDKMYISNERLIELVENLLNISRIESGQLKIELAEIELAPVIKEIFEDLRPRAEKKRLQYTLVLPPDKFMVKADANRLYDIVINLIDNSIKYTPEGFVKVSLSRVDDDLVMTVSDSGIGISANDLPRLFGRFTRAQKVFQMYTEGLGLGLYVARVMLEQMQGKIWAQSPGEGKGSTFAFSLPIAKINS